MIFGAVLLLSGALAFSHGYPSLGAIILGGGIGWLLSAMLGKTDGR